MQRNPIRAQNAMYSMYAMYGRSSTVFIQFNLFPADAVYPWTSKSNNK